MARASTVWRWRSPRDLAGTASGLPPGADPAPLAALHPGGTGAARSTRPLWVSLGASAIALGVMVLFGTPLAYLFARGRLPLARIVELGIMLPLMMPPLLSACFSYSSSVLRARSATFSRIST